MASKIKHVTRPACTSGSHRPQEIYTSHVPTCLLHAPADAKGGAKIHGAGEASYSIRHQAPRMRVAETGLGLDARRNNDNAMTSTRTLSRPKVDFEAVESDASAPNSSEGEALTLY